MIFSVALFGVLTVVSAVEQVLHKIPQDKVLKARKIGASCALEYNVDPELFPRILDGTLPRDESTNKYLYCIAVKIGVADEDGYMVIDKIAGLVGDHPLLEEFKQALIKCNEVTTQGPVARMVETNLCLTSTAPIRFIL